MKAHNEVKTQDVPVNRALFHTAEERAEIALSNFITTYNIQHSIDISQEMWELTLKPFINSHIFMEKLKLLIPSSVWMPIHFSFPINLTPNERQFIHVLCNIYQYKTHTTRVGFQSVLNVFIF